METLETNGQTYEIKKPNNKECLTTLLSRLCVDLKENTGETEYFFERNGVITVRNREVYMERIIDYGIKSVVGHLIGVEIK